MPCIAVGGGKYRLGQKGNVYKDKATCERVYAAYRAKKHSGGHHSANDGKFIDDRRKRLGVDNA